MLTECALPGWAEQLRRRDQHRPVLHQHHPARRGSPTLYSGIRSRAPYAKVVVVGYPRIFNGEDCNAFTWFSPAEESRLNQTADLLNSRLGHRRVGAPASPSPTPPAASSATPSATPDEWINGLSNPISESYHPKATGHAGGYTPTVSPLLTGATVAVTADVVAASSASAGDQAALQQQYADADRTIEQETFVAPDLTTPEARRAARRAGVDIDRFIARSNR